MQNGRRRESMYYSIISQISNNFHQRLNYRSKRWNQERVWERLKFGRKCKRCEVFPKELKEKKMTGWGGLGELSLWAEKREEKECYQHIIELWHFCPSRPSLAAGGHINNISTPFTVLSHWHTHAHTHCHMVSCSSVRSSGVWVKIEYMMKVIGHMREKKEGGERGQDTTGERYGKREADGIEKKRCNDAKFRLVTCSRLILF